MRKSRQRKAGRETTGKREVGKSCEKGRVGRTESGTRGHLKERSNIWCWWSLWSPLECPSDRPQPGALSWLKTISWVSFVPGLSPTGLGPELSSPCAHLVCRKSLECSMPPNYWVQLKQQPAPQSFPHWQGSTPAWFLPGKRAEILQFTYILGREFPSWRNSTGPFWWDLLTGNNRNVSKYQNEVEAETSVQYVDTVQIGEWNILSH